VTKDEQYSQNLLKLLCAEGFFLASMTAAHEMYGKSYFSLGVSEKQVLDQALTPEWFGAPTQGPTGFQPPDNQPASS
jgi:hypothetical protein